MKKNKAEPLPSVNGTWELLSLQGEDLAGNINYPFEMNAEGICFFDANNNFSIQYSAPDRPRLSRQDPYYCEDPEIRIAYLSARAFYGTYQLTADTVAFNIENSSFSNISGLLMKYAYRTQGDTLHLISPKMRLNGQVINEHSFWYQEGFELEPKNRLKTTLSKFKSWLDKKFNKSKISRS